MVLVVFLAFSGVLARDNSKTMKQSVPLENQTSLKVRITFGAGSLIISRAPENVLFKGELKYYRHEPRVDYSDFNNTAVIEITTPDFNKKDSEDKNITISGLDELKQNVWHLYFTDRIPMELTIETGASDNELHLGGLQLTKLKLSCGASETYVNFSKENPVELESFKIEAGVSKLTIDNMLNAHFNRFRFNGGMGDYNFYLDGKLHDTARLDMHTGIASTKLVIAPDIPFQAQVDHAFLSSVDIEDAEEEDDVYTSLNFDRGEPYLKIFAETGIGSFKIERGH